MHQHQTVEAWSGREQPLPVAGTELLDPRVELGDQALVVASRNAFPIVAQHRARKDGLGLAAGAAIALVLGLATFASLSSSRESGLAAPAAGRHVPGPQQTVSLPAPTPPPAAMPAHDPAAHTAGTTLPATAGGTAPQHMHSAAPGQAPVLVFDGSSAAPAAPARAAVPAGGHAHMGEPMTPTRSPLAAGMAESPAVRSTRIADPANTVAQGTLITAVLETGLDSDLPGYVRALVSHDVRSFDGSKVLVPRSSRLIGEYKSGLAAGQRRAYVMWTRLIRPDGVSVALASPATDFSGRSGLGGEVNDHFFSRFGSAILLSVLGGLSAVGSGGSTLVVSGGQSAASVAAQRDSQRPPTIRVRQGEPVRIFTARDLIFSPAGNG